MLDGDEDCVEEDENDDEPVERLTLDETPHFYPVPDTCRLRHNARDSITRRNALHRNSAGTTPALADSRKIQHGSNNACGTPAALPTLFRDERIMFAVCCVASRYGVVRNDAGN